MARRLLLNSYMEPDRPILRARDLMQRDIITVSPDMPILDVYRLFVEEEIHGAPVVDDSQIVCGVITTLDLLRVTREELEPGSSATASEYFRADLPFPVASWMHLPDDIQDHLATVVARDAMSKEIVTVDPETVIDDVARTMLSHRIHRVLVSGASGIEGVLTTFDLLRAIARPEPEPESHAIRHTGYQR